MHTIFYGGKIVTMDRSMPVAQAVAIDGGIILRVGRDEDILPLAKPHTQKIDLKGRLMLPGFIDSHLHLLSYGYSLEKVNLGKAASIDDCVTLGQAFMAEHPELSWIQGRGWNNDLWDCADFPTRYDLDRISGQIPVTYTRTCGHIIVANSAAMRAMGVTRDTPQIAGGLFDVDERGEPLGIFREEARQLVYQAIPGLTEEDMRRMLMSGGKKALEHGITSVQSDDFEAVTPKEEAALLNVFFELSQTGRLPLRVYEQCLLPPAERLKAFLDQGYTTGTGNPRFRIGPLKLLCDGGLGARTALLSRPYADAPATKGIAVFSQTELDHLVATAHNARMTVAMHSIGDGCLDMCLDAIERAVTANPLADMRHSIIHCQITRADQLRRFRDLNVIAHIQPVFIDYDMHIVGDRVGPILEQTSYNWKSMADLGVHYACGSDCPVEPFNVMEGIYSAVTRKDRKGFPDQGWLPDQKMTVMQAVHGYTMGGAYASYEESVKGSITVGKYADLTVLEQDIFNLPPEKIQDVRVAMTILDGELAYTAQ